MPMPTGNCRCNFMDSEMLKTECLLKVYKGKEAYQLGFQVCRPWKYGVPSHHNKERQSQCMMIPKQMGKRASSYTAQKVVSRMSNKCY